MNEPCLENYDELCRLCASYDAIKMDIFSDRGKERKLLDKITTCLPFQVSEDDLLPKSLCYRCIYNLENFYVFRRECIDALARLENVIKNNYRGDSKDMSEFKQEEGVKMSPSYQETKIKQEVEEVPESEGEQEPPNPADFLEAYLGECPPANVSRKPSPSPEEEEGGPFRCGTCSRVFNTKSSLTIHAKFHRERNNGEEREVFSCYVCDKIFSSKGHLALHSRVHIGETHPNSQSSSNRSSPANIRLYQCDLCNKSYSMAKHLWGHVSTSHRGDPLVTCNICLRTFSSISNLDDHKRVKHKNNNIEQQMKNLTPKVELAESSSMADSEEKKAGEEAAGSRRKSSKPRKIERETESLPDEEFSQMTADSSLGGPEASLSCMFCGEQYEDQTSLSNHLLTYHMTESTMEHDISRETYGESEFAESMMEAETVFCCEICVREFSDKASLWLHMLYSHREEASKACGICLKICLDNDSLIQHVEMSHPRDKTEQRRYSCQVCARQHDSRKKLVTHAKIHKLTDNAGNLVDPETVVVLNSDFYPNDAQLLQGSMEEGGYLMHCEICYKVFETEAKLVKHKRSAHRDSVGQFSANSSSTYHYIFACEICGLSHSSRTDRWRHMATTHAGDPSVTCELEECGKVFPTSAVKKEHCENHHAAQGQYPNTCEVCGKMWKTRVEYWKHMMGVHSDCLPYICGVCLKVFCSVADLVSHVRSIHWPITGGDFCCDICGRPYSKASKMSRHRKIHNVPDTPPDLRALLENPKIESETHFLQQMTSFTCDMCEGNVEEYERLEDLNKHRRTIHNVMPCDLCTKYYGRTSHLWKHVNKIHKGHPEITCHLCQRTSASRLHLSNHMSKHHRNEDPNYQDSTSTANGKAHSCEKCSKIFRKESLMKKHSKHCKGPRPPTIPLPAPVNGVYTCEKCKRTFTVQNTLYKHMRNSHIAYNCELCDKVVDSKTELYSHICEAHADHPDAKCDFKGCDKILRCKADLERHKKDHRQYYQLHICEFCAEMVTSKFKMRKHLKIAHTKETKFLCALCLKALPNYEELRVHAEEFHPVALSRPNTCPVCVKPCSSKTLLEHIKKHGSTFHPCKICFKILSSKEELNNHITNHPSDSGDEIEDQIEEDQIKDRMQNLDAKIIMDIIGAPQTEAMAVEENDNKRKADDLDETTDESSSKKSKLDFTCIVCNEEFETQKELVSHQTENHEDLRCETCEEFFAHARQLKKHSQSCTPDQSQSNDKSSSNSSSILESVLSETKKEGDDGTWEKDVSDKSFMHQLGLIPDADKSTGKVKNNRKVYSDDFTPSMCEICGKVWPAKRHLWQHLIRFHRTEAGTSCGVCLKLCLDYETLATHLCLEHSENFEGDGTNLSCRVCGKYHNARSKLQNHVAIHVGHEERAISNMHHCLHCDSKFGQFSKLCEHNKEKHNYSKLQEALSQKLSTDGQVSSKSEQEGPKSTEDGKEAPEKGKLPFYSCEVCSLAFASEIGLTNHRRMHEHSDNFKCGQCGEVFGSVEDLGNHKIARHKGAEFVCADCKSNFSSYVLLIEHNKQCKIKIKNSDRDTSSVVEEDDPMNDIEECEEDSVTLNGTPNDFSSSETELDKTDVIEDEEEEEEEDDEDDEVEESELSDTEEQKSMLSVEASEGEPTVNSGDEEFEELVEVVEVDLDPRSSPKLPTDPSFSTDQLLPSLSVKFTR